MGRAVFEACQYSIQDDGIALAKVENIIRRDLFLNISFDGDLSRSKAQSSFPFTLKHLMEMIL